MPDIDPLTAALDGIRERAAQLAEWKPPLPAFDSATDVPRLLAAVEAVLAVADDCRETTYDFDVATGDMRPVAWTLDPQAVREAITRALTGETPGGKEAGDGR